MIPRTYLEYLKYKLKKNLERGGIGGTAKVCVLKAGEMIRDLLPQHRKLKSLEKEYDRKHGVSTDFTIHLDDLDVAGKAQFRNGYEATPAYALQPILKELQIRYADFFFIDLGSGMGRAILMASEFPFKKVIGVEFSAEINSIAQHNIRNFRSDRQRCRNIETVCEDASEYIPPAENTVFYLYNPFQRPVLETVLQNIRYSMQSHPRQVFMVYYNAVVSDLPKVAPFLVELRRAEATAESLPFVIYRFDQILT